MFGLKNVSLYTLIMYLPLYQISEMYTFKILCMIKGGILYFKKYILNAMC